MLCKLTKSLKNYAGTTPQLTAESLNKQAMQIDAQGADFATIKGLFEYHPNLRVQELQFDYNQSLFHCIFRTTIAKLFLTVYETSIQLSMQCTMRTAAGLKSTTLLSLSRYNLKFFACR
jgi:hypothetical protein